MYAPGDECVVALGRAGKKLAVGSLRADDSFLGGPAVRFMMFLACFTARADKEIHSD